MGGGEPKVGTKAPYYIIFPIFTVGLREGGGVLVFLQMLKNE